jgi:hypothetical protein
MSRSFGGLIEQQDVRLVQQYAEHLKSAPFAT